MLIMDKEILTPTMEDYLEAILFLEEQERAVRVKDIAKSMNVKLPTVTSMLNTLIQRGLVNHEKYEYVELTDKGQNIAKEVKCKHEILSDFLSEVLGVDQKKAEEDACKMEHAVSPETMERLVDFMEFIEVCPRSGASWLKSFATYRTKGHSPKECLTHMKEFAEEFDSKLQEMTTKKKSRPSKKPLAELSTGQKGRIIEVKGTNSVRQRIQDMGIVPGAILKVERTAPYGDLAIKIKGYHLSLRKEEASRVYIEEV
jgi:DtxR family Mn-dependent transcriptional regulator